MNTNEFCPVAHFSGMRFYNEPEKSQIRRLQPKVYPSELMIRSFTLKNA